MLETPHKHTKEDTMIELRYKSKDALVAIYHSHFPSLCGEIQYLIFLASVALYWIPPLFLLWSSLFWISFAKGVWGGIFLTPEHRLKPVLFHQLDISWGYWPHIPRCGLRERISQSVFMAPNPSEAHTGVYCRTARDPLFWRLEEQGGLWAGDWGGVFEHTGREIIREHIKTRT